MNNSILVRIMIFTVGVGVGFLAGKQIYEGYYESIAQEEIESVKEKFGLNKPIRTLNQIADEKKEDKATEQVVKSHPLARSSIETNPSEQAKRNYNLVKRPDEIDDYEDEEDDEEDEDEDILTDAAGKTEAEMALVEINRDYPYAIDDREFSEDFDSHDKVSLYYYRTDDVLCDEHEEVIDDIEGTIGYDALSQLDTQTTVWVRNEPICIDYEIISINRSYSESVHGIGIDQNLSPREKYARQQKRRDQREE